MKKFLVLSILLSGILVTAQNSTTIRETSKEVYDGMSVKEKHRGKGDMVGTPYMNEQFLPGKIDGIDGVNIRYNAFANEIEYQKDGEIYKHPSIPNKSVVELSSPKKKYVYVDYKDGKKFMTGYLVELVSGKITIYKKETKKFIPGVAPKTSYDRQTPDEYKLQKDEFFIKVNDGEITELTTNKKNFAKLFGDKEKEVAQYLKEKDISLNNENNLKLLGQFLNSTL